LDAFLNEGSLLQLDAFQEIQQPNMSNLILLTTTETSSLLAQVKTLSKLNIGLLRLLNESKTSGVWELLGAMLFKNWLSAKITSQFRWSVPRK
jgi:hypothetical protein